MAHPSDRRKKNSFYGVCTSSFRHHMSLARILRYVPSAATSIMAATFSQVQFVSGNQSRRHVAQHNLCAKHPARQWRRSEGPRRHSTPEREDFRRHAARAGWRAADRRKKCNFWKNYKPTSAARFLFENKHLVFLKRQT